MAQNRFRWSDAAQIFVCGRPVADEPGTFFGPERDFATLRSAIRTGSGFASGAGGVEILTTGEMPADRFLVRSGGTTGKAKAIRRSQRSWIASFEVNRGQLRVSGDDAYGVLGPPSHSLALYAVLEAAHLGASVHAVAGLAPRRQAELLVAAGVTVLYATPTQLGLLADAGARFPALRHVLCGGGRMPAALRRRLHGLAPAATVTEFYGAAETSFIAWGSDKRPEGSVGRAYPGVEIRILAAPGEPGEIWVAGPYLFDGYADGGSADTRRDGHFLTVGEIGRLDPDGNLYVLGRKNRMVTVADLNVFPEDIEELLLGDPEVSRCAVLPLADARRGTVLVAVVAGDLSAASRDRLIRLCRGAFGPLAAPRRILCLPDFPVTAAGKPDLAEIAARIGDAS